MQLDSVVRRQDCRGPQRRFQAGNINDLTRAFAPLLRPTCSYVSLPFIVIICGLEDVVCQVIPSAAGHAKNRFDLCFHAFHLGSEGRFLRAGLRVAYSSGLVNRAPPRTKSRADDIPSPRAIHSSPTLIEAARISITTHACRPCEPPRIAVHEFLRDARRPSRDYFELYDRSNAATFQATRNPIDPVQSACPSSPYELPR